MKIRGLEIGRGRPKICVPIVASSVEEALRQAQSLQSLQAAQLLEWRWDCVDKEALSGDICPALTAMRAAAGDKPLLVTMRTAAEGGNMDLSDKAYEDFYEKVLESGAADLIDLELLAHDRACLDRISALARRAGVRVIMSSHDFQKTPPRQEILERLRLMEKAGADILKIAVMPADMEDVLELLAATQQMHRETDRPLITMAMGAAGCVSRSCGGFFGSAVTFGAAGRQSAPGQMDAVDLEHVLNLLYPDDIY